MNMPFYCEKEPMVIEAVRRGRWEESLQAHAQDCPVCADAVLAARFLEEMRVADLLEAKVPDAGWMWWRAQLRARREAARRATQPITLVEHLACACAALSLAGLCVWQWRSIRAWLASGRVAWHLGGDSVQSFFVSAWEKSGPLLVFGAAAILILFSFVALLIWADD
jgi:hypothetical protein